jgi:hypothetical protein
MPNPNFVDLKKAIIQWVLDHEDKLKRRNVKIEVLKNTPECFHVIFIFELNLAGLTVAEPAFAPYRFVSFEVLGTVNGKTDLIQYWYDQDEMSIEDTVLGLSNAMKRAMEECCNN